MEGFLMVFVLSVAMFLGCYVSGSVPLAFSFSESKLRFVTVFGAGLLVGTALAVIIPEGVGSIYEAQNGDIHSHTSHHIHNPEADHILETANVQPNSVGKMPDKPPGIHLPPEKGQQQIPVVPHQGGEEVRKQDIQQEKPPQQPKQNVAEGEKKSEDVEKRDIGTKFRTKRSTSLKQEVLPGQNRKLMQHGSEEDVKIPPAAGVKLLDPHGEHHAHVGHLEMRGAISSRINMDVHTLIGLALVIGFVFMLVVDQVGKGRSARDVDGVRPRYKITATVGLVVHAAADGIALGAASTTKHTEIQFIVFMAIMLHKAPAAFGLVTFLMHEGLEKSRIRKHLLVFASAAPALALITYLGISQGGSQTLSSVKTTGVLMLFSAGTFLYVATVHVLPEIVQHNDYHQQNLLSSNPSMGHSHAGGGGGFRLNELVALIAGALLPSVLTFGHSH